MTTSSEALAGETRASRNANHGGREVHMQNSDQTPPHLVIPRAPMPARRVLRLADLLEKVALSRTTIWRLIRAKKFLPPLQLSANRIAWFEDEVDAWLESQPRGLASSMDT
jgi:prophage regulatory protein